MNAITHTLRAVDLPRLVRLSDTYWKPWFAELLNLAEHHGIQTSDDADLWWDDFGAGKTPQESMDGFLASDEWAVFRNNSLPNTPAQEGERDSKLSDAIEAIRHYEWTSAARHAVEQIPAHNLASAYDWTATYLVELELRISSANDQSPPTGGKEA